MRTDWVGGFPCRGPEAPQRALQAIFPQRDDIVKYYGRPARVTGRVSAE